MTAEAAVRDQDHVARCRADNTRMRHWLALALAELGVPSDTSRPTSSSPASPVPTRPRPVIRSCKSRASSSAASASYKLPHCLRITVGDEASCRRVAHAIAEFKGVQMTA